jgi:RimJ/RimL family protein N-acetyltransferase
LADRDVPALFAIFSDPEVMRYWSHAPFEGESEARTYVEDTRQGCAEGSFLQWGVARSGDDALLGTCTLWKVDPPNRRSEIGFVLGREHWGRGLMTEALETLFEFAFDRLGLERLEADVDPANAASIALLERLGFVREGFMRERWWVGGKAFDSVFYGLLAREWSRPSQSQRRTADL